MENWPDYLDEVSRLLERADPPIILTDTNHPQKCDDIVRIADCWQKRYSPSIAVLKVHRDILRDRIINREGRHGGLTLIIDGSYYVYES